MNLSVETGRVHRPGGPVEVTELEVPDLGDLDTVMILYAATL